jgi:Antitoxin-like ribbon-helix-helix
MSRKRTSLSAVLGTVEDVPSPSAAGERPGHRGGGRRPGLKQQTAYLPEAVYEQLRALAFEERRKMHDLLMEGLDRVFKQRGLRSIEDLTSRQG